MYRGMQWYKCDLQMQTPGDSLNWVQHDPAYITGNSNETEIEESVDMYLKRCHETNLDVIGITDHNFLGKDYLKKLQERNPIIAQEYERKELIIFPGFEIEISTGHGVHLLCLFDPNTDLEEIEDIVTRLGLPRSERTDESAIVPSPQGFDEVIGKIQENDKVPGLVIAAHPRAENGILNDKSLSEYFQRKLLTDPRLLAIEIPRPIENMTDNWKKLLLSRHDCNPEWKRENPVATIMSSDCYSLEENDKGFIGKRSTWIKMSELNLKALKQAMIDHKSRVSLQNEHPLSDLQHGRIKSMKVEGTKFLEDQDIHFSPNFNCIIGGRGSGKSSLLEYIRFCVNYNFDEIGNDNKHRTLKTLQNSTVLKLEWEDTNSIETFEFDVEQNETKILDRKDVVDPRTIFKRLNVQIYSQKEITEMSNKTNSLLPIIDDIVGADSHTLKQEEQKLKDEIKLLQNEQNQLYRKTKEEKALQQEIIELQKQWDSFEAVKQENYQRIKADEAKQYLRRVWEEKKNISNRIENEINTILQETEDVNKKDWPRQSFFETVEKNISVAKENLIQELRKTMSNYHENLKNSIFNHEQWQEVKSEIENAKKHFEEACEKQEIQPAQLNRMNEVHQEKLKKEESFRNLQSEINRLTEKEKRLNELFDELYKVWKRRYQNRKDQINKMLQEAEIPTVNESKPFIEVNISYMKDKEEFFNVWNDIKVNKNKRVGKNWDIIGEELFAQFMESEEYFSPWILLNKWLNRSDNLPSNIREYYEQLQEVLTKDILDDLMITRIEDEIDINLYREDGSKAGSLLDGGLSDGQKNTAILTLLLIDGNGPIIVDQPEDELDSDFIYNQLVPLIRSRKEKRQIIISSHNANLPVNADSELVHALRTSNGRGNVIDSGGLDNDRIRRSILDIMEGSEEAFRKRREKYSL